MAPPASPTPAPIRVPSPAFPATAPIIAPPVAPAAVPPRSRFCVGEKYSAASQSEDANRKSDNRLHRNHLPLKSSTSYTGNVQPETRQGRQQQASTYETDRPRPNSRNPRPPDRDPHPSEDRTLPWCRDWPRLAPAAPAPRPPQNHGRNSPRASPADRLVAGNIRPRAARGTGAELVT